MAVYRESVGAEAGVKVVSSLDSRQGVTADYYGAQVGTTLIAAVSGKKLQVLKVYVDTRSTTGDFVLQFSPSGGMIFRFTPLAYSSAQYAELIATGDVNDCVILDCPAISSIAVVYRVID